MTRRPNQKCESKGGWLLPALHKVLQEKGLRPKPAEGGKVDNLVLVAEVPKNQKERIFVQSGEFKGHPLVGVRIFAVDGDSPKPTAKGLTLRPETWKELLPHIQKALAQGE